MSPSVILPREVAPPTTRQQQILQELARGKSQIRIAGEMNLAEVTVKKHMGEVYRKWGAGGATEAVAIALDQGFILPPGVGSA